MSLNLLVLQVRFVSLLHSSTTDPIRPLPPRLQPLEVNFEAKADVRGTRNLNIFLGPPRGDENTEDALLVLLLDYGRRSRRRRPATIQSPAAYCKETPKGYRVLSGGVRFDVSFFGVSLVVLW